jgi:hypothetical protein
MIYIKYIVFFLLAHLLLMQVFRFSTYHRYFWRALPALVTYSGVVGWALYRLNLPSFFIWHVVISCLFFANAAKKQRDLGAAMLTLETEPESHALVALSLKRQFFSTGSALSRICSRFRVLSCSSTTKRGLRRSDSASNRSPNSPLERTSARPLISLNLTFFDRAEAAQL